MKIKTLLVIIALSCFQFVKANNLEAYFMYSTYFSPEGAYVDTYISTIGNSAVFVENENGNYQAEIEITIIFYKNAEIETFTKQVLKSPEISDTLQSKPNFLDVQRIALNTGVYNMQLTIKDLNAPEEVYNFTDIINIKHEADKFSFSSVQFIESVEASNEESVLTKHGYKMIPYISDFFPSNSDRLVFYTELYNTQTLTDKSFLVTYYISRLDNGKVLEQFSRFKKMEPQEFNVLLGEINISELYSGNYYLNIDI
ncbi:MAG: hypothetical protein GX879_10010, partial [Bacteroidales bacterium]|nr:hypothetical protein [Bacteroidales bacterium]